MNNRKDELKCPDDPFSGVIRVEKRIDGRIQCYGFKLCSPEEIDAARIEQEREEAEEAAERDAMLIEVITRTLTTKFEDAMPDGGYCSGELIHDGTMVVDGRVNVIQLATAVLHDLHQDEVLR